MKSINKLRDYVYSVTGRGKQNANTLFEKLQNCCFVLNALIEADNKAYASILHIITYGYSSQNPFIKYAMFNGVKWDIDVKSFSNCHKNFDINKYNAIGTSHQNSSEIDWNKIKQLLKTIK